MAKQQKDANVIEAHEQQEFSKRVPVSGIDDGRKQALALKFREPSITFTS
jgi:hypothetical protein